MVFVVKQVLESRLSVVAVLRLKKWSQGEAIMRTLSAFIGFISCRALRWITRRVCPLHVASLYYAFKITILVISLRQGNYFLIWKDLLQIIAMSRLLKKIPIGFMFVLFFSLVFFKQKNNCLMHDLESTVLVCFWASSVFLCDLFVLKLCSFVLRFLFELCCHN